MSNVIPFPLRRATVPPRRFEVSVETPDGPVLLNHLRTEAEVQRLRANGWQIVARQVEIAGERLQVDLTP